MDREVYTDSIAPELFILWRVLASEQERELLSEHCHKATCSSGERIFSEGDAIKYLYYLHRGKVKMFRAGIGGRNHITRFIRPGQFFGIRPFFAHKQAQTTAVAYDSEVVVFKVDVSAIRSLLDSNPKVCQCFLEALSLELELAEERTISLTQKHIRGRLAETLLTLARHYGYKEDGTTLAINLSRGDLAAMSNMTTSNAIRTLSVFSNERIIALEGRRIRIVDPAGLEEVSRLG